MLKYLNVSHTRHIYSTLITKFRKMAETDVSNKRVLYLIFIYDFNTHIYIHAHQIFTVPPKFKQ